MLTIPKRGRRTRRILLVTGIAVFIWSGIEDSTVLPVTALGTGLSVLTVTVWVMGRFGGRTLVSRYVLPVGIAFGGSVGLGASVWTALLMFFKDARHAHVFPDYPLPLILAILERAPLWAVAGGLIGLAVALVWLAVRTDENS